jgi:DeoR/GlpR family transcriptional regulator of sugar metabolism
MLAASAEHWLVADHTKVNHCEPWLVAGLSAQFGMQRAGAENRDIGAVARHQRQRGAAGEQPLLTVPPSQEADADVKRAMLAASAEHWLVADHTKVNHCEPWRPPARVRNG